MDESTADMGEVIFEFPSSYDCDRWVDALRKGKIPFEEEINGKGETEIF